MIPAISDPRIAALVSEQLAARCFVCVVEDAALNSVCQAERDSNPVAFVGANFEHKHAIISAFQNLRGFIDELEAKFVSQKDMYDQQFDCQKTEVYDSAGTLLVSLYQPKNPVPQEL